MQVAQSPHPEKAWKGGEDAYFLGENAFGVFDGVGAWEEKGFDVGKYSKELAILREIQKSKAPHVKDHLKDTAEFLVSRAKREARKRFGKACPFAKEAARAGLYHRGGKMDDVTVVVALVTTSNSRAGKLCKG